MASPTSEDDCLWSTSDNDVQAQSPTDDQMLNNIIDTLCTANSHQERAHISAQLRTAVDALPSPADPYFKSVRDADLVEEYDSAIAHVNRRLQNLLNHPEQSKRLGAISAFSALLHTETESIYARAQRASNALRVLFTTPVSDMTTARAASNLVSTLADINSPLTARVVDHVLVNAINIIASSPRSRHNPNVASLIAADRARAAMVITDLANVDKAPKFVLRYRHELCTHLWDVVWDVLSPVREQGVHGLQAILKTVVLRAPPSVSSRVMNQVLSTIRQSLSPASNTSYLTVTSPQLSSVPSSPIQPSTSSSSISFHDSDSFLSQSVIHGSLCMLGSLMESPETVPYTVDFCSEICNVALRFQAHSDPFIRKAVADILPDLVRLDIGKFNDGFLDKAHASTIGLVHSDHIPPDEKGRSLISLASLWAQLATDQHTYILEEILQLCEYALSDTLSYRQFPRDDALITIAKLAGACIGNRVFEATLRRGLLMKMFSANFTSDLVSSVLRIKEAVPSLAGFIHGSLINLFAATLMKGLPDVRTGMPSSTASYVLSGRISVSKAGRKSQSLKRSQSSSSLLETTNEEATFDQSDSLSDGEVDQTFDQKIFLSPASRNDFFRQYPFSSELHHIDSSSSLSSKSSHPTLEGLIGKSVRENPLNIQALSSSVYDVDPLVDKHDSPCVALKAIVSFDFGEMKAKDFTTFAKQYVIGYVESNSVKTRALAVAAAAALMESGSSVWASVTKTNGSVTKVQPDIQAMLANLVLVAVTDPSKDVRYVAIRSLDKPYFRMYLLQPEVLNTLFMCFHDESLAIRDSALSIVGRLGNSNPAYILPALRAYLTHLLTVLRLDGSFFSRQRQEATELINTLVNNARFFVEPYTGVLMEALLLRLEEAWASHDAESALPVLKTIAVMGGPMSRLDLKPFAESFVPLVVSWILEVQGVQHSVRRAALRALASFVQNTESVIKPYVDHPSLLPRLLELLRVESDPKVRWEVEALLGSLGAVGPDDHKYAALPVTSVSSQLNYAGRGTLGDQHSKSLFRSGSHFPRGSVHWGPRSHRSHSNVGPRPPGSRHYVRSKHTYDRHLHSAVHASTDRNEETEPLTGESALNSSKFEDIPKLSWFYLGGTRLNKLLGNYTAEWYRDDFEYSLVGQLEHPFSANVEFFPSVLLDELHRLITTHRPRYYLWEACQAIVNILRCSTSQITYFLPDIVARMLWLVRQLTSNDSKGTKAMDSMKFFVIHRLCDIVTTAGLNYKPFSFDTVLLVWNYLRYVNKTPHATIAFCSLLSHIRAAIGDEFKPIIATILPHLLAVLGEDNTPNGSVTSAVLAALESFCPLYEDYSITVLKSLTDLLRVGKPPAVREAVLKSLLKVIRHIDFVTALSNVVHPLVQILAGVNESGVVSSRSDKSVVHDHDESSQFPSTSFRGGLTERTDVALLASLTLMEVGLRSPRGFNVFVPVITKALKNSSVFHSSRQDYESLKTLLFQRNPRVVRELLGDDAFSGPNAPPVGITSNDIHEATLNRLMTTQRGSALDNRRIYSTLASSYINPIHIVEGDLIQKWEVEQHFTGDDWVKWMSDLSMALFQYSGNASFRACIRISESYPMFTKSLFNAAFLSCWSSPLTQDTKSKISGALDTALTSPTIPLNILQTILNLYEFMDHDEKPLPAPTENLASTAFRCGALAKAVRYREQSYNQFVGKQNELMSQQIDGSDGLIAIYEKLGHIESAIGTITHYQERAGESVQEEWFEKLQKWDQALKVYDRVETEEANGNSDEELYLNKRRWEATLGRLRCLNQIGEWRCMADILHSVKGKCVNNREAMKQLALEGKGLSVSFDLGLWDDFEDWLQYIRPNTYDACYYNAVVFVKRGHENPADLDQAEMYVQEARRLLDQELTARVSEGYPRAYSHIVRAQTLVELEEMVCYLRLPNDEAKSFGKPRLIKVWNERLAGCKKDRLTWYRLLMTRSLVIKPTENKEHWLEYATMCRKAKLLPMASEALTALVVSYLTEDGDARDTGEFAPTSFKLDSIADVSAIRDLEIKFACIKHLWAKNYRFQAYAALEASRHDYLAFSGLPKENELFYKDDDEDGEDEEIPSAFLKKRTLAAEVYSKLSKWGHRLQDSGEELTATDPLKYAMLATSVKPLWYKAWHYWAVMNGARFESMMEKSERRRGASSYTRGTRTKVHVGKDEVVLLQYTVRGYFRAINLCGKSRLEDSLKVLTLWFRYGGHTDMHKHFNKGFRRTNITRWLEVVPQIIARLHTSFPEVQAGVKQLLSRIGTAHPHVAVYPLTVAKNIGSRTDNGENAACDILAEMKRHHPSIVDEAEKVARELVRVAVLWTELWYEKLEEASKIYFVEHDIDGMIDVLLPLHDLVEKEPETDYERNFKAEFGQELEEAAIYCRKYQSERREGMPDETMNFYIQKAWNLYTQVFRKVQKHQQTLHELHLSNVSNQLDECKNLTLAVPGTYNPDGKTVVGIDFFEPKLQVMQSKQRPRRLSIVGRTGSEYHFLLKGHEDLRQDERVMQVFGLINKLFSKSDQRTILDGVGLKRYSVTALSPNAGLIEWVPDCDTMHALVKNFREVRKIVPNIEQRVMLRCAPEPERLPLLQKVDLFEYMLQSTAGADLSRVIWLKSRNSEMWLDRRTMYAKSLATTSMTGYLLGLGDRHPSNLMIERATGKVMHIDFGDCFEVAMKREKYPERVPFRLTRMLVDVLEPCEVNGYFRHTSIATLDVLRQKNAKESMMSMMEAFVYDPLIRWKLIGPEELTQLKQEEDAEERKREVESGRVSVDEAERARIREGLGRDVAQDIQDIVSSLSQTGSLAKSLRQYEERTREQGQNGAAGASNSGNGGNQSSAGAVDMPGRDGQNGGGGSGADELDVVMPSYEVRMRRERMLRGGGGTTAGSLERFDEVCNERAQSALNRIADKLSGTDFWDGHEAVTVERQVDLLVEEARNVENLCTLFLGWCAFW